jgi:hypothetical protein
MRGVETPIFLRLGARMRGPTGLAIGTLSRVSISDVTIRDADPRYPSTIAGIPGHDIQDVRISNVRHYLVGGLTPADAVQNPPELEDAYPENYMFGTLPAYGFYIRHATGVVLDNVRVGFEQAAGVPTFDLTSVDDFTVTDGRPVGDIHMEHVTQKDL